MTQAPRRPLDADLEARIAEQQAKLVAEFNKQYMVVNENGKVVIFQPMHDPILERTVYNRLTFEDLNRLYLNNRVVVAVNKKGETLYDTASKMWLGHKERKQYIKGVVFDPTGTKRDGVLNLWQGFAVEPKPGKWDKLRTHIWTVICKNNKRHFWYLLDWMARLLQRPDQQGEVAVVLRGDQGAGKGIMANALRHIVGQHGMRVAHTKHLVGNFNLHLRDCIFLFGDECFFAGDKQHVGLLKSMITEDTLTIEGKHMNVVETRNFLHLMLSSNEEWVVPAELSDRRFFVLEVSNERVRDYNYFKAIMDELENGGYEAMLDELMARDLTKFNVRDVPQTEGLQRQKQHSLDLDHRWWQDVLHRGYIYQSKLDDFREWYETVSTELLFTSYEQYAEKHRHRHPLNRVSFGMFMRKLGAKPVKPKEVLIGEGLSRADNTIVAVWGRKPSYHLGSLELSRAAFCESTGLSVNWQTQMANGSDNGDDDVMDRGADDAVVYNSPRTVH